MDGDIEVDSEAGRGSTFTVRIRLEALSDQQPSCAAGLAGRRVLVVDDNPTNLRILDHQLTQFGARCVLAAGGAEALHELATSDPFDLAVLDLHMPRMDGVALARAVHARPETAALPLVLLSSSAGVHADELTEFAARLHKPVRPDRLLSTLCTVLAASTTDPAHRGRAVDGRPVQPGDAGRLRVLVAEDHAVNARLMSLYLDQLGHDCDHVENGEQAVDAVLGGAYDVVLMDAQMPVMGGVDATAAIRALPGPQPVVMAVTASVLASDRAAFLEAGADLFLTKPVRLAVLEQALSPYVTAGTTSVAATPVAAAATDEVSPLDAETVDELRDLGDDGFRHLYVQYVTSLESTVAALLAAAEGPGPADDEASMHRLAHRLKGSSAALGALRLAELCQRLEDLGSDLSRAHEDLLTTLEEESTRVRSAVQTLLEVST